MYNMINPLKNKKGKGSQHSTPSTGSDRGSRGHGAQPRSCGKGWKIPLPPGTCYCCGKGRHQKDTECKALEAVCQGCNKKGHFEKVCLSAKHSTHSLEVPQASTSATGAGEPLYFDDQGQPVFNTHMVSVLHSNKHLIKFPISLDYRTLRSRGSRNKMENSTDSTGCSKCSTILLKADTVADVNLMNKQTFDQLFGKAKDLLQPTPIRMENYGNTAVKVLGKFHAFLQWKDRVYKQVFYVTDCDRSPNLYTLGVLKPCYTVERQLATRETSTHSTQSQVTPIHASKVGNSFLHQEMKGTVKKLSNNSTKCSISKEQLQGSALTKQDILETYSDIFIRIGKFPGLSYKFQLKPNAKPA